MAAANVSYDMIVDAYTQNKDRGVENLLGKDENGIIKVSKDKRVLTKICGNFKTRPISIPKNSNETYVRYYERCYMYDEYDL